MTYKAFIFDLDGVITDTQAGLFKGQMDSDLPFVGFTIWQLVGGVPPALPSPASGA